MKKVIGITVLVLGLMMGVTSTAAQDATQNATVNVSVGTVTEMDVRPTDLSYTVDPGNRSNQSDSGYTGIEVENTGSTNISNIWAETSQPSSDPFGTGTSDAYDTGNFIQLSTSTANDASYSNEAWEPAIADSDAERLHYVNRVEFSDVPKPTYIDTLADDQGSSLQKGTVTGSNDLANTVGRFREGDEWYFYVIYYDSTDTHCDTGSHSEMWVGKDPHTQTSLGTTDFTDSSNVDVYGLEDAGNNYGATNSTVALDVDTYSGSLNYDVFTYCDNDNANDAHTIRTKFNTDVSSTPQSTDVTDVTNAAQDVLGTTNIDDNLNPGAYFPVDVSLQLPLGVVSSDINEGELKFLASKQS